jgi:LysR family transcriptional regulator, nod-box dependent transcriptional activator
VRRPATLLLKGEKQSLLIKSRPAQTPEDRLDIRQLDLNLLVALDALLAEKSVSRAARQMCLTQSALSKSLRRLQREFDDELLVTVNGRRMVPTLLAEQLIEPVHEALLQVRKIASIKPRFNPGTAHKKITLSTLDHTGIVLLPAMQRRVLREAPHVVIRHLPLDHTWKEWLERGDTDFVLIPKCFSITNYPALDLFEDTYCCIVWSKNRKVGRAISLEQYLEMQHALVRLPFDPPADIDIALKAHCGKARKESIVLNHFSLLPATVVGTELVATMQTRLARYFAQFLPIKVLELPFPMPPISIAAQYQPYHESDLGMIWFRDLLREAASKL